MALNLTGERIGEKVFEAWRAAARRVSQPVFEKARKNSGYLMSAEEAGIVERQVRNGGPGIQITLQICILRLIVPAVSRHHQRRRRDLGSASRTSGTLLVVGYAWGNVSAQNSLQVANVDPHFHRCRAAKKIKLALPKLLFDVRSQLRPNRRCVLTGKRSQRVATVPVNVMMRLFQSSTLVRGYLFERPMT